MSIVGSDDLAFERRWHRVQRVGRALVGIALLAAIAGVFGTGPLAHATASAGSVQVDYDRFLRTTQSTHIQISSGSGGGPPRVTIDQGYLSALDLSDVSPQPDSETARGTRLVLSYQGSLPAQIQIGLTPKTIGVHTAAIEVGATAVRFRQVVWP